MFDMMVSRDLRQTLDHFRRSVDQLLDNFYSSGSRIVNGNTGSDNGYTFTPVIESGWNENELMLRAIVPGVTHDSLKVTAQSVPAKKKRFGKDPFTGEERWFAAKPASVKVKSRALKKLKDAAL